MLVLYSSSGDKVRLGWWMLMLVLYSSSGGHGGWDGGCLRYSSGMVGCLCWCCIVLVVDKVRLGWWMLMLVLYSSRGGHVRLGWWMLMLVLYSSSG